MYEQALSGPLSVDPADVKFRREYVIKFSTIVLKLRMQALASARLGVSNQQLSNGEGDRNCSASVADWHRERTTVVNTA